MSTPTLPPALQNIATATLTLGGQTGLIVDLPALAGEQLKRMPWVLRLLLENAARCMQGHERAQAIQNLLAWCDNGTSEAEIEFQPGRVLMHDTTSTPALVDIAAMRDALAEAGHDPALLNPVLPVDVSVDHSLAVQVYAQPDAVAVNLGHEMRRNRERYSFLKWAANALTGVRIHPPGTGIMHTLNLEQLASVVCTEQRGGQTWWVPDMMLGTDSHTPMVNGIGVLGWGVGGLEAQTVMFGMPTLLRIPDVVGVKLTGELQGAATATDLALTVTQALRKLGVAGEFVEFFGSGAATLSAGERCVLANMAPEYGATTGFFAADEATLLYLQSTGRSQAHVDGVRTYLQRNGLWFEPSATPRYTHTIALDLAAVSQHIAGPKRPQDRLPLGQAKAALAALNFQPPAPPLPAPSWPASAPAAVQLPVASSANALPRHAIAIAAITSCTNTSDPAQLIAAGLLARKAHALGLRPPPWVKTSLSPGSPAAAQYLARAGLLEPLEALGFGIVGYGCATCIGNPGPLPQVIQQARQAGHIQPVAVLSGNRNFPGRVHPDLELGFLMAPAAVIAFALAGDAERDLSSEPLQFRADGQAVYMHQLWPSRLEVAVHVAMALDSSDFKQAFTQASANPAWADLRAPASPRFEWQPSSTTLRRPPFADLLVCDQHTSTAGKPRLANGSQLGHYRAHPLLVLGDDVTTDHISPASAIPPNSLVADFLVKRGEARDDLNVFASRRGNWEVMLRAAFHNKSLVNLMAPKAPVAHTLHAPSGQVLPLWEAAKRYQDAGHSLVLVAGERYGTGSSRDWAAKGQRLLGIRAVLACSFERIHRANLIGMGILPLKLAAGLHPSGMNLQPGDQLEVQANAAALSPRCPVAVRLIRGNGNVQPLAATAAIETQFEVQLLRAGGVLPHILSRWITLH